MKEVTLAGLLSGTKIIPSIFKRLCIEFDSTSLPKSANGVSVYYLYFLKADRAVECTALSLGRGVFRRAKAASEAQGGDGLIPLWHFRIPVIVRDDLKFASIGTLD